MNKNINIINKQFLFFSFMCAFFLCLFTSVFRMGIFTIVCFCLIVMIYLNIMKSVSSVLYRLLRFAFRRWLKPLFVGIKRAKIAIELDEDNIVPQYNKSKNKQIDLRR